MNYSNTKLGKTSFYRGLHYKNGTPVEIRCENGYITRIMPLLPKELDSEDYPLPWVAPGLVDLQVNGYNGIDLNHNLLTNTCLERLVQNLWSLGITSFLPTIITNSPSRIRELLGGINEALESADKRIASMVAGIHLEGPFISPEEGPRGAHDSRWVMEPDLDLLDSWQQDSGSRLRIITFSPEWEGSDDLVRWCVKHGIIASIGHTAATSEQIRKAIQAGASLSTHLGNGSHLLLPRHPNYIWEQLSSDELTACVIADGYHLSDNLIKVFYRAKAGRLLLVSDSVGLAGMPPGTYHTAIGGEVVLSQEGRLSLAKDDRILAGSAMSLKQGIEHLNALHFCSWHEVWDMASIMPASVLWGQNSSATRLMEGSIADLVLFYKEDERINVQQTVKCGETVWQRS